MNLRLLDAAKLDIAEIAKYYDSQQAGLGDKFVAAVETALDGVQSRPESFSLLETLPPALGYRRVQLTPFRYLAIYRILRGEVLVSAVVHTSRKPNFWLKRSE